VHQDHARAAADHRIEHRGVGAGCDVVHDVGAGVEGLLRDRRRARIHRQEGLRRFAPEAFQHRQDARRLILGPHRLGPRSGRLATHVDDVGTLLEQPQPVPHRGIRVLEHPAVAE
jgi:hypothetical protein